MQILDSRKKREDNSKVFLPEFYTLPHDEQKLHALLKNNESIDVYDSIESQAKELIECRNPKVMDADKLNAALEQWRNGRPWNEIGVWVYYPWSKKLIHLLDKEDFIQVRTNRNQYKITPAERDKLEEKTIGIIGLSVGQSIALTLAMERSCGALKLADFDNLELSNLNRIRTPLCNIQLPKVIATAREIVEMDPYIQIEVFREGITRDNLDDFLQHPEPLDLLVDECDGLDIKVLAREKAKALGIPVIMDTSDRGMLDIERFDLEPGRPLFHGLAGELESRQLEGLSNFDKLPYILKILGADDLSPRAKASALEVNQSLKTWPQIATSVVLGGAAAADIARRILLDEIRQSGRFFVDIESIIPSRELPEEKIDQQRSPELSIEKAKKIIFNDEDFELKPDLDNKLVKKLVKSASLAPSGGNVQPWKWLAHEKDIYLLHDQSRSRSLLDFAHTGSYYALGSAIENFIIEAHKAGFGVELNLFPKPGEAEYVARLSLTNIEHKEADHQFRPDLYEAIPIRVTNRKNEGRHIIHDDEKEKLLKTAQNWKNAQLKWLDDPGSLEKIGNIASEVERLRLLDKQGHFDTINEIRWTKEETIRTRDGLDIETLELDKRSEVGVALTRDWDAVKHLKHWDLGGALKESMKETVKSASAIGLIIMNTEFKPETFIEGGRMGQQIWMEANLLGLSFQPISPSTFFFNRMLYGKKIDMNTFMRDRLKGLEGEFLSVFGLNKDQAAKQTLVFMFRLNKASAPTERALRLPVERVLLNEF